MVRVATIDDLAKETANTLFEEWYERFDEFFKKYNPCDWQDGSCVGMRRGSDYRGATACCGRCTLHDGKGCTTRNVACKAYLCNAGISNLPEQASYEFTELQEDYYNALGFGGSRKFYITEALYKEHLAELVKNARILRLPSKNHTT